MSRNFTPDQLLIDQLRQDDSAAFEELFHRYFHSLFTYCSGKLHDENAARKIVREIFISLWESRHNLPADFSVSLHFYLAVRRSVVQCLNEKFVFNEDVRNIETNIIPSFKTTALQKAKKPVTALDLFDIAVPDKTKNHMHQPAAWWRTYFPPFNLRGMRYALQRVMHLW